MSEGSGDELAFVLVDIEHCEKGPDGAPKLPSGITICTTVKLQQGTGAQNRGAAGGVPDIPDYELVRRIGQGTFGEVWLARNRHDGQLCAIKVFPKSKSLELEGVREYRKRAAGNPFLAPIYHLGESGNFYYYVMPLADDAKQSTGHWLPENYEPLTLWRHLIWHGRLPPEEVAQIALSLLNGLQRLHAAGAVHCDVKPANVMRFEGVWKVGDPTLIISTENLNSTRGTFRFWPPEGTVDHTADLYALGKTMYVLLAGAQAELPVRIEDAPLPSCVEGDSPIWRIIERACASDSALRYRSAAEMRRDLESLLGTGGGRSGLRRWTLYSSVLVVLIALVTLPFRPGGQQDAGQEKASSGASVPVAGGRLGEPQATDGKFARPVQPAQLQGDLTVRIWNPYDSRRRAMAIDEPGGLPLRQGDQIRVEATLNREAYVYLVWIGTDGSAQPIYPWTPGDWSSFPAQERAVRRVALPRGHDEGWPVTGPPGMETVLLLASTKPVPQARELRSHLRDFPAQPLVDGRPMLVRLDHDAPVTAAERGLDFTASQQVDDPLLQAQRLLAERLAKQFELIRIVSFANTTGETRQEP